MKNKKCIFSISIILILIAYVLRSRPQDEISSMGKMISKQTKTNQTVTMYNTIIIDDYRLGALYTKKCGGVSKSWIWTI